MKLGYVVLEYAPAALDMAARCRLDCAEVFADPGGKLDVRLLGPDDYARLADACARAGVTIESVACSVNHMEPDAGRRAENRLYFRRVIENCRRFGAGLVMTNAWGERALSPAENLKGFAQVFSEYARIAQGEGVRIVVENCPHAAFYPRTIGNIGYSPEMWAAMLDAVPCEAWGLEYDPSHLYWQRIDYLRALRDFGSRIYACHAKDTRIDADALGRTGIFGQQIDRPAGEWDSGWWLYCIPGQGEIDWPAIFAQLRSRGYDGPMFIEHEDPTYFGERFEEGLALGSRYLRDVLQTARERDVMR